MNHEMSIWVYAARAYAAKVAMDNEALLVSVNEIYTAIMNGELPPPPKIRGKRRGMALCLVFNHKMFSTIGHLIPSNNPYSKGRKISVWKYLPWEDERNSTTMTTSSKGW